MRRFATTLSLSLLILASACWNEPDNSYNVLPYPDVECEPGQIGGDEDAGGEPTTVDTGSAAADATGSELTGPCSCLTVGTWYRFDSLGLNTLDRAVHPVISTLNPLWIADMDVFELNILLEVLEVTQSTLRVRAVNGARVGEEGDICVLEDTGVTFDFPREGCTLKNSDQSGINVYSGDETHPKNCTTVLPVPHAIAVQQVVLEAQVSDSCDTIGDGKVISGVIGQQDLLGTCTCLLFGGDLSDKCGELEPGFESAAGLCKGCNDTYVNLEELLNGFGKLDYLCKTTDDGPGVCLDGFFSAYRLDTSPPSCGQ
jgi:hypothetical protein